MWNWVEVKDRAWRYTKAVACFAVAAIVAWRGMDAKTPSIVPVIMTTMFGIIGTFCGIALLGQKPEQQGDAIN